VWSKILAAFLIATAPYTYHFPRDHFAHDAYRTEWWYFTGHLRAPDGHRFGYELTFF
jgi:predicted secreted hydrolase